MRRGVLLALALLILWLIGRWLLPVSEHAWSVTITADRTDLAPWETAQLTARVDPPLERPAAWTWSWQEAGRTFATDPARTGWKGRTTGRHQLTVTVKSPGGTRHSATITLDVHYRAFVSPLGRQDPSTLASDPAPADLRFGIADIWVEKSEVCQGEPTRIRVTPFDDRGEEKWLIPQVAETQAWEAAFVMPLAEPGLRAVPVQVSDTRRPDGADGAATTYVMIDVKDCVAPFPMYLEHHAIPPRDSYVGFAVHMFQGPAWQAWSRQSQALPDDQVVRGGPPPLATAAGYRWSFGDGTANATTTEPAINHRYPDEAERPDEVATTYTVTVEAIDPAGAVMATAYGAVRVANVLRELKHISHLVQLVTEQTPWSTANDDGSRTAEVTLRNIDATETVSLTGEVTVALKPCGGGTPAARTLALGSIFAGSVLAPGQRISGRFTLSREDVATICWADAEVHGQTSPGDLRALGFFTLDTGQQPTRVYDDQETAVMMKVMDLLGHPPAVSDDQIRQLEDDGKIPRGVLLRPHTDDGRDSR